MATESTPPIHTTIAAMLERRRRTGMVFQDALLNAVVELLEYTQALERRLDVVEKAWATDGAGWVCGPVGDLGATSVRPIPYPAVAPSQEA